MRRLWLTITVAALALVAGGLTVMGLRRPDLPDLKFLEGEEPIYDRTAEWGWGRNEPHSDGSPHDSGRIPPLAGTPSLVRYSVYTFEGDIDGVGRYMEARAAEFGGSGKYHDGFGRWSINNIDVQILEMDLRGPMPVFARNRGWVTVQITAKRDLGPGGYFVRFFRSPLRALGL